MLRDGQPPAQRSAQPILQTPIGGVSPHQLDGRKEMLQTLQQEFGPCTVMDVSGMHLILQERALGVDEQMALAALDLLAAVVPTRSAHLSGPDRLAVNDRAGGLARPADATAITLAQGLGHVLPRAVLAPLGIVVEYGATRWILVR